MLSGAQLAFHKCGSEELGEGMQCCISPDVSCRGSSQYLPGEGLVLTEGFLKGRRDTAGGMPEEGQTETRRTTPAPGDFADRSSLAIITDVVQTLEERKPQF